MRSFNDLRVSQKLLLTILVTGGGALLLAGATIVYWDQYLFRQRLQQDLLSVADIVAENSNAAIASKIPNPRVIRLMHSGRSRTLFLHAPSALTAQC
jgi:hypothetical protein